MENKIKNKIQNKNKIFEIKSFARIKYSSLFCHSEEFCHSREGGNLVLYSQKINFFDKIYFQEKNNWFWAIEIRKKIHATACFSLSQWRKFPTNAENSCFLVAKEMQKIFAKKNKWIKPKSIIITIEKNIPLNSWLWWAVSNAIDTIKFLNKFWEINLSDDEILKLIKKILLISDKNLWNNFISYEENFLEDLKNFSLFWNFFESENLGFSDKKIFILIPKYIFIEKEFFQKILENSKNFSDAQEKIKNIFPDLEKFIKIFLDNWAEFSDISWKWWAIFWIFDKNISQKKIDKLKNIFLKNNNFWEFKIL